MMIPTRLAALLILASAPYTAFAGFRVVSDTKPAASISSPSQVGGFSKGRPAVQQYGQSDVAEVRQGFGKELPLSLVVKQIVPQGWETVIAESVSDSKFVSWKGGKSWTEVLGDLAVQESIYADVDWDRHKVTFTAPKQAVASAPLTGSSSPTPAASEPVPASKSVPVVSANSAWVARSGPSLRRVVEEWAAKENWIVVWDAQVDYPVEAIMSFRGGFTDSVAQLLEVYKKSKTPLYGNAYVSQKLIQITE